MLCQEVFPDQGAPCHKGGAARIWKGWRVWNGCAPDSIGSSRVGFGFGESSLRKPIAYACALGGNC
jgi:hypothetical protein